MAAPPEDVSPDHGNAAFRPGRNGFVITPGASPLEHVTRGLYVGVTGNITVTFEQTGNVVEFLNLAPGIVHPFAVTHVIAATATGIVGIF